MVSITSDDKMDLKLEASRREIKKKVAELSKIRGSGTELISLYIPPKYPIGDVAGRLRSEYSQASNIKSKQTRNNVLGALERILNFLKHFNQPPDNGIAIFAGNISKNPGESDIKLFYIVPPDPIGIQLYRCDSSFFVEPLLVFTKPKEAYGLLAIDGSDATLAILEGKNVRIVRHVHSTAPSKTHKGGQSAARYQRLVEIGKEDYYKRVGEAMDEVFLNVQNMKGVIIGGPGPIKDYFLDGKYFNYQIKVLGKVDTGYSDENGIHEIMHKLEEIIANQEAAQEKRLVQMFIENVVKGGLAAYGVKEVVEALEAKRVNTLLLSEGLYLHRIRYKCQKCGQEGTAYITAEGQEAQCSCGGKATILDDNDMVEELENLAESSGAKIEFISTDTPEGGQFLSGFFGIGALLRY
ncbi:MAG: peptide chain release factor aRF-1 [Candidatus Micrarchaeota archaeon]|nr:peptide chain release factor aRF-1 [Candidatus Micrarchaeota archaeon]